MCTHYAGSERQGGGGGGGGGEGRESAVFELSVEERVLL